MTKESEFVTIDKKVVAIVKFGPAGAATDGFRPAEYFQVTIDPEKISPSGEYIRFGNNQGDEIQGWQRCAALTVIEILGEWPDNETPPEMFYGTNGCVTMWKIDPTSGSGDQ